MEAFLYTMEQEYKLYSSRFKCFLNALYAILNFTFSSMFFIAGLISLSISHFKSD
jgi:hypothetical protein